MSEALIALGGNVGDVRDTFRNALTMLCTGADVSLIARSRSYLTPPWGVKDQPPFINCCAAIETTLSPHDLLTRVQAVEQRVRPRPRQGAPLGPAAARHRHHRL